MRHTSFLLAALMVLPLPALAQSVMVFGDDSASNEQSSQEEQGDTGMGFSLPTPPQAMETLTAPSQPERSSGRAAATSSPITTSDGALSTNMTPEERKKAEMAINQLAAQYPELRVNGFSMTRDYETLSKQQDILASQIRSDCATPGLQVMVDPTGFFGMDKAIANFGKIGAPFIASVVKSVCRSSDGQGRFSSSATAIMINNAPGTKAPGFSVDSDGTSLIYTDDFSNDEPPGLSSVASQLDRTLTASAQKRAEMGIPSVDPREMQQAIESIQKR